MRHFQIRRGLLIFISAGLLISAAGGPMHGQTPQSTTLTLKDAEAMALRNHPLVQAATLTAQAEEQVSREAKSAYYPTASANLTAAGGLPNDNSYVAAGVLSTSRVLNRQADGLQVNQLVTDFGRTSNLVASTKLGARAASQSAEQTQQDVLLSVNRAYYGVLRAQALLQVALETVKARQVLTDQITTLEKNQLKSALDVAFAQVDLAKAKLQLVQAQNGEKAAYAELANTLGMATPQPYVLVDEPLPPPPPDDPTDLVAQALVNRPDLASSRFTYESAQKFARAERDLWMPTVSAVGAAGLVPAYQAPLMDHYEAAGVNVNIPIFNGFLFSARHQEASLRAKAADQDMRDLADRIARDVRVAWANAVTSYQNLDVTAQLLNQATLALNLSQGRYKLSLASIVELSESQLNLTQAQIDNTNAKYDFQIEQAIVTYETGQLR